MSTWNLKIIYSGMEQADWKLVIWKEIPLPDLYLKKD